MLSGDDSSYNVFPDVCVIFSMRRCNFYFINNVYKLHIESAVDTSLIAIKLSGKTHRSLPLQTGILTLQKSHDFAQNRRPTKQSIVIRTFSCDIFASQRGGSFFWPGHPFFYIYYYSFFPIMKLEFISIFYNL